MATEDEEKRRRAIATERAKLTATYLNNLAVASMAVGFITPLTGFLVGGAGISLYAALVAFGCFAASVLLHLWGRSVLKGMKP